MGLLQAYFALCFVVGDRLGVQSRPARPPLGLNRAATPMPEFAGPSSKGGTMSDTVGVAGDRIRSFVERIEQLDTELQELNEAKKEVLAEAKGEGFDVKVLKEIIRLRKQDKDERDEHEVLLDVCVQAMQSP